MDYKLTFLCGARDFHAMDWYRNAKILHPDKNISIVTDLISSEGFNSLLNQTDTVHKLLILDRFLFKKQSKKANIWRNFLKLLFFPIQVFLLKKYNKANPTTIYHAHSMYYLFLSWASGVTYIGTAQGSDILIRPFKSSVYKYFAIKSLKKALAVTVDSLKMKEVIYDISGVISHVIQDGIDIDSINIFFNDNKHKYLRKNILSIRGLAPIYRISELIEARNHSKKNSNIPIILIYPFVESQYEMKINSSFKSIDVKHGRLKRLKMYELLAQTKLVISIPESDSSPRSVYESIFCGCAVAITYQPYYDVLPIDMKSRIVLIDLQDETWFDKAIEFANKTITVPYAPSKEALDNFDQKKSFNKILDLISE